MDEWICIGYAIYIAFSRLQVKDIEEIYFDLETHQSSL